MHENDGFLKEADLVKEARLAVDISDGRKVEIRRISRVTLAIAISGIPDLAALATEDGGGRAPNLTPSQAEAALRAIDKILIEGVLQPKLHAQFTEGATPSDFSEDDRMTIYHAILDHSGWNKKAAGEVIPFSGTSA
jgi:hypothetical protein